MSIRAVLLGLLGATAICAFTFFNDMVMRGTFLVGNFLPVSVFGVLVLFLLFVNPLLACFSKKAPLSGKELGVIVALTLFACFIPGRGLMHQFTTFLMLPHHYARTTPAWQGDSGRISATHITDWDALSQAIAHAATDDSDPRHVVAQRLPEPVLDDLRQGRLTGEDAGEPRKRLLVALNAVLADPGLHTADAIQQLETPPHVKHLLEVESGLLSEDDLLALNRGLLDTLFAGILKPRTPGILEHVPPRMLGQSRENSTVVVDGFVNGLAVGDKAIAVSEVPWKAWQRPLSFWAPLILAMSVAIVGLSLVLHRQWASHEHLPYPTVEFASALLPGQGEVQGSVFRNRLFWLGTVLVLLLHMNNYACAWWPQTLIRIQTRFDFYPLLEIMPVFKKSSVGVWTLFRPTVYFTVIGFAYFLATDASLSLGLAPYLYAIATGILAGYGVAAGRAFLQPSLDPSFYAGSYCGMFCVLVYTGRQYYRAVFARSVGIKTRDRPESHAVWGARMFLGGALLFIVQLVTVGLDWQLAILYTFITVILLVVISRLVAEAGVFYLHAYFFPCALLWGFMGTTSIGADQLLIMGMVSSVLLIDPREALMPFVVSGLQLVDTTRGKVGRAAIWGTVALIIGLTVAIPATLYLQYRHGAIRAGDGWTCNGVPKFVFNANSTARRKLQAQGSEELSQSLSGWSRFGHVMPSAPDLIGFSVMFCLVLLFTFLRHRFAWWPLHPLLFLVLATWQSRILAFSFLIGWAVKAAVTKYGGAGLYQRLKPLMIGLVTGEMLAGVIPMIIGALYYFITGERPEPFSVYR